MRESRRHAGESFQKQRLIEHGAVGQFHVGEQPVVAVAQLDRGVATARASLGAEAPVTRDLIAAAAEANGREAPEETG